MLFFVEIFMGFTKLVYSKKTGEDHLDSQADVLKVDESILFKIYKFMFPFFLIIGLVWLIFFFIAGFSLINFGS